MTDTEREQLASRIQERRASRFGTKRAAYTEAGVNPMTWDRAESGDTVREDLMRKIVRSLWPATDGDWRRLDDDHTTTDVERVETDSLRELIRETVREMLRDSGKNT